MVEPAKNVAQDVRFVERLEMYEKLSRCFCTDSERSEICHTITDRDYRQRRSKIQADAIA